MSDDGYTITILMIFLILFEVIGFLSVAWLVKSPYEHPILLLYFWVQTVFLIIAGIYSIISLTKEYLQKYHHGDATNNARNN